MESPINELIAELKKEKRFIKKQIRRAVEEGDYLNAHFYNLGLGIIDRQLNTVCSLIDPYNDRKASIQKQIRWIKKMRSLRHQNLVQDYYKKHLKRLEDEKASLESTPPPPLIDSQHLDQALALLVKGSHREVRLHLIHEARLFVSFTMNQDGYVVISFPLLSATNTDYFSSNHFLTYLHRLNFSQNDKGFSLTVLLKTDYDFLSLKELLARILFEGLGHTILDKTSSLEIFY